MVSSQSLKQDFNFLDFFKTRKYNMNFYKSNPTYFRPDGLVMFVGVQGSGKSLSAVNYVYNLRKFYPKSIIVTNLELLDYPYDNKTVFPFEDATDLTKYSNGQSGVIFLIDEIQLYFNSLQSKNINMDVMAQISQQRKQRKHIVCTSQVFGRLAKPLREQFDVVILCKKRFGGYVQNNLLIDRDSLNSDESTGTNITGKVVKKYFYFRNPSMFKRYDTYKIIENKNLDVSTERSKIYDC